jgi:hypothetical protein
MNLWFLCNLIQHPTSLYKIDNFITWMLSRIILTAFISFFLAGCFHRELRGTIKRSTDKGTYLVVLDKDSPNSDVYVDGVRWPHSFGEKGIISPGSHKITCGGTVQIEVKEGTVFRFDYWGP